MALRLDIRIIEVSQMGQTMFLINASTAALPYGVPSGEGSLLALRTYALTLAAALLE